MTAAADILNALPALKWVWVAFLAFGVLVSLWTTWEAWVDARWVKANSANAAKRIQAGAFLRAEFVTLVFQLGLLFIRLWSIGWPSPSHPETAFAAFVRNWGWDATFVTALQMVLAYERWLNLRDRRRVNDLVRPRK